MHITVISAYHIISNFYAELLFRSELGQISTYHVCSMGLMDVQKLPSGILTALCCSSSIYRAYHTPYMWPGGVEYAEVCLSPFMI